MSVEAVARNFAERLPPYLSAAVLSLPPGGEWLRPVSTNHEIALGIACEAFDGDLIERVNNSDFYYLRPFGQRVRALIAEKDCEHETDND